MTLKIISFVGQYRRGYIREHSLRDDDSVGEGSVIFLLGRKRAVKKNEKSKKDCLFVFHGEGLDMIDYRLVKIVRGIQEPDLDGDIADGKAVEQSELGGAP